MTTHTLYELINRMQFLSGLADDHRRKLVEISEIVDFPKGTEIFPEGSKTNRLYLLVTGRVELCMTVPSRGCLPILTLESGDLLGWSAALGDKEMSAAAVALLETQAIAIQADKLRELCRGDHDIGYEIMHRVALSLSRRLVATRLQLLDTYSDSPVKIPVRSTRAMS